MYQTSVVTRCLAEAGAHEYEHQHNLVFNQTRQSHNSNHFSHVSIQTNHRILPFNRSRPAKQR